jgi:YVTN family beta-propeller protein
MIIKISRIALMCFATIALLTACGSGSGGGTPASSPTTTTPVTTPVTGTYTLKGQFQKGPFAIGSAISVNELDENLNPTGIVYNIQTSDDLGNFSVATKVHSHLVEIIGDGFYMDELTGQLSTTRIQLRAIADLNVNPAVTVNILTSLQELRLKALITQGQTYAAANTQSQNEVLTAFGIDPTKVAGLSNLYSMKINGSADQDSVLLALSVILSQMATNAATTNVTSQPAELSNYVNTIAAQIQNAGAITNTAYNTARSLAATLIPLATVRSNIETYYATRGIALVAPKFEEWIDKDASGVLPRRLVPNTGLLFSNTTGVNPNVLITSNTITVAGIGTGIAAPVTVDSSTTLIKNGAAITGSSSTAVDGDTIALRVTSLGYGLTNTSTISVGSTSATWAVASQRLSGTISGLTSTGLVLQNNLGDNITITTGSTAFSFPTSIVNGANYSVTILSQPTVPVQSCFVNNSSGTVGAAPSNISVACSAVAGVVYVANQGSNNITTYTINADTGALSSIGTFATAATPAYITVNPTNNFAYVSENGNTNNISTFSINAAGALTTVDTVAAVTPTSIAIEATGKFAYVANYNYNTVTPYSINSGNGSITGNTAVASGSGISAPMSVTVDPTGKFVYVANSITNDISAYTINTTTGALTSAGLFGTGTGPYFVTVDPTGKFAYTANYMSGSYLNGNISAFTINTTTGALTSLGTVSGCTSPVSIAIDPSGKFAYVAGGGISAYTINTTTGALTFIANYGAGSTPQSVAIDRTGKFVYVANWGSNNISAYAINATTGALTSIGTIAAGTNPFSIAIIPTP